MEKWNFVNIFIFAIVLAVLSTLSYRFVEQKTSLVFKNRQSQIKTMFILSILFFITTGGGFYFYWIGGIVRDIPELGITVQERTRGIHSRYNSRVYGWDRDFSRNSKIKILLFGNSFARDMANVLAESPFSEHFEISYFYPYTDEDYTKRLSRFKAADYILCQDDSWLRLFPNGFDREMIYCIGTKDYGKSMGIIYSQRFQKDYYTLRVRPASEIIQKNRIAKMQWEDHYIDFLSPIMDRDGTVPAFSPEHMLISQDCRHLTRGGAKFYAAILDIQCFTKRR